MQVLREQGWISSKGQLYKYTMDMEMATNDGNCDKSLDTTHRNWSVKNLMTGCLNFTEEMMPLQHVGHALGFLLASACTPKIHAKMVVSKELNAQPVGTWGSSKSMYHIMTLDSKKKRSLPAKALVNDKCTDRGALTTPSTAQKLSLWAQQCCICDYYVVLHQHELDKLGARTMCLHSPCLSLNDL